MPDKYAWILLHLLSNRKISLPSGYETQDTAITFWSGYQSLIAEKTGWTFTNSRCKTLRYVNSAYTALYSHEEMHINVTCTWSVIFSANNGPTALLHSKARYVVFTRLIQQPHYAT